MVGNYSNMTTNSDKISLELTTAEALVFFEWITKQEETGGFKYEHDSEERMVWNLQGQLEKKLTEPLANNYEDKLAEARRIVSGV